MKNTNLGRSRVSRGLELLETALRDFIVSSDIPAAKRFPLSEGTASGSPQRDEQKSLDRLLKFVQDYSNGSATQSTFVRTDREAIPLALDAHNVIRYETGPIDPLRALKYLEAMQQILSSIEDSSQIHFLSELCREQKADIEQDSQPTVASSTEKPSLRRGLAAWRNVCQPHADVLDARFSDADFAADLLDATRDSAARDPSDPAQFFKITYLTRGLQRVLRASIGRLYGRGGEPVINLQTNFGGGKTHTMLALYHFAQAGNIGLSPSDFPDLKPIFDNLQITALEEVRTFTFVGTHKGPAELIHRHNGNEVRTLWGHLALSLGGWGAVDDIIESEKAGTNPGSQKLISLLESASPCLILLDEVVAFSRQLTGLQSEAFHSFIQSLTEAARTVDRAVVVVSLPEAEREVGDGQGLTSLRQLESIVGRVQSSWTPATGVETFEIIRRRLFMPVDDPSDQDTRSEVVRAYCKMYKKFRSDFPTEASGKAYEAELLAAYPIHPDLLRRLSTDWSDLPGFQRTRGILRLMANVVYALWHSENADPLIVAGSMPFGDVKIRTALLDPLHKNFLQVLQGEVDGELAISTRIESRRPRLGTAKAVTRAARSVFFATAPHEDRSHHGITANEVRLACAKPGDNIGLFSEALSSLVAEASHLYQAEDKFWFSVQPTLRKVVTDKVYDISDREADDVIRSCLQAEEKPPGTFSRVHRCTDDSTDIQDDRATGLVILPPNLPHLPNAQEDSSAQAFVKDSLLAKGDSPRMFRNALVYLAPDGKEVSNSRNIAKQIIAWRSVLADDTICDNLTRSQLDVAKEELARVQQSLEISVRATWIHLLVPHDNDGSENVTSGVNLGFRTEYVRVTNPRGRKDMFSASWETLASSGLVYDSLGPKVLASNLELVWPSDTAHMMVDDIVDAFATHLYLPRVRDPLSVPCSLKVLIENPDNPFVIARSYDPNTNSYHQVIDCLTCKVSDITGGVVVKKALASSALESESEHSDPVSSPSDFAEPSHKSSSSDPVPSDGSSETGLLSSAVAGDGHSKRRFWATIRLEPEDARDKLLQVLDGLIAELKRQDHSNTTLVLEVTSKAISEEFSDDIIDNVTANARDIGLLDSDFGFEPD